MKDGVSRRAILTTGAAAAASAWSPTALAKSAKWATTAFPNGFLWGAATAGHQVEGNNINSDCWVMENVKPTVFAQPSGDAVNSFTMWPTDMDLAKAMGLNSYRFSLEWSRIEPEEGLFSVVSLEHYKRMIEGCRARGMLPCVTFNHFTTPRWFAASGGWTNPKSPALFARYCDRAARYLSAGIGYALTFNEPNIPTLLRSVVPPQVAEIQRLTLAAAARVTGSAKFVAANVVNAEDLPALTANMVLAHKAGRAAIKAVRPDLQVGLSLAMFDDQAMGKNSMRDAMRNTLYQPWLDEVRSDDFLGVQNYERQVWTETGKLPPPEGSDRTFTGGEVYAPSLAGAVRFAHAATGIPIIVTEHGVGTSDDAVRARLIPAALVELRRVMTDGVPVKGYYHWSLLDNFEWIFGYKPKFGLHSVDPVTFARTAKPSAKIYGNIARANRV
jgi:beta-glucosidase